MPGRPTAHTDWQTLAADLEALNELEVHGVTLLRNRGVRAPDGRAVLDVPEIEGLLAAPHGLPLDLGPARDRLRASGLPLDVENSDGLVRLVAAR